MHQTSNDRNHLPVDLKLSIGQCKVIERLLDSELSSAEAGTSEFEENTLKRLLDTFWLKIAESPKEKLVNDVKRAEIFEAWASKHRPREVNHV